MTEQAVFVPTNVGQQEAFFEARDRVSDLRRQLAFAEWELSEAGIAFQQYRNALLTAATLSHPHEEYR